MKDFIPEIHDVWQRGSYLFATSPDFDEPIMLARIIRKKRQPVRQVSETAPVMTKLRHLRLVAKKS